MADRNGTTEYSDVLDQARDLIRDAEPVDTDLSLEEILAEYGGGTERRIFQEAAEREARAKQPEQPPAEEPQEAPAAEPSVPEETISLPVIKPVKKSKVLRFPTRRPVEEPLAPEEPTPEPPASEPPEPELPKPPRPLSMEEVVGRTVDAVMEEQTPPEPKRKRRGLFSRKPMEDTEQLPAPPAPEEEEEEDVPEEELPLEEAAAEARRIQRKQREMLPAAVALTVLLAAIPLAESRGVAIPVRGDEKLWTLILLAALALVSLCCRGVFVRAVRLAARKQCSVELVGTVATAVTALDCCARLTLSGRSAAEPYVLPVCAALTAAQWALARRERGLYDAYRTAAITTEPPYSVTDVPQGACKQDGRLEGFYTDSVQTDLAQKWQTALMPLILTGTLVFGGLSSLGKGRGADFLLCWSATLAASASMALPLAWSLPWSKLSRQLQKSGAAVAGWGGAAAVSRKQSMILTDLDLFPPGSVQINGIKVYGEKVPHAVSYAATLIRESGSGLTRLFDDLLHSEGGQYRELTDFRYYEEGGCSGMIRGESVLLGTASFARKMDVRLPGNLNLHTGLYLAVDRQLVAVFAVKYSPADNVDWALRMLRRNHITPVLASRDPNLNPALLKRKFSKNVRVLYPPLATRLALSEQKDSGRPRALLLREGLLPYAEVVAGSHRLRRSAQDSTLLSLLGSAAGLLLSYYLCSFGNFALLQPSALLVFQLLWTVPVLLLSDWAVRY